MSASPDQPQQSPEAASARADFFCREPLPISSGRETRTTHTILKSERNPALSATDGWADFLEDLDGRTFRADRSAAVPLGPSASKMYGDEANKGAIFERLG